MSFLLAILYPIAIQYERKGWWYIVLPITLFALIIDVIANHTELVLLTWDYPRKGERTFSDRLLRLQHNTDWRGGIARVVVAYCNYWAPNNNHISTKQYSV